MSLVWVERRRPAGRGIGVKERVPVSMHRLVFLILASLGTVDRGLEGDSGIVNRIVGRIDR